MKEDSCKFVIF